MPNESTASRIAEIEKRLNVYRDGGMSQLSFLDDAADDIAFLLKLAKPEPDGWVAVSERLPDEGTLVQLHLLCGDVSAGHLFGENWWVDGGRYSMEEVLAWKSMSAPPVLPEGEKA